MNSFSIKNVGRLTTFELKNSMKKLVSWCIAIFAITFLYMILFPSVKDMAQVKMEAMPKELLQFVGMSDLSDMSNFITYFGMIFNLILIAICIFAATFSAGIVLKEEKEKTIEFLYSLTVSRVEIFVAKFVASLIGVLAVIFSCVDSAAICGLINGGQTFDSSNFLKIITISGWIPLFFMAISLMVAGFSSKIGAQTIGSMAVVLCYVLGYLSELLGENGKWLSYLSPFNVFSPQNALDMNDTTSTALVVYSILSVVFICSGCLKYKKRDFKI